MWIAYDSRLAIAARDQGSSDIKELFAIHPDNPTVRNCYTYVH